MEMRLPPEKLERLSTLLKHWYGRKVGSHKVLQHACNVVRPDYTFLRSVYELLARTHRYKPHYSVCEHWSARQILSGGPISLRPGTVHQSFAFCEPPALK